MRELRRGGLSDQTLQPGAIVGGGAAAGGGLEGGRLSNWKTALQAARTLGFRLLVHELRLRAMRFIGSVIEKLQRHPKRIVFPEGAEPRVLQAARQFYSLRLGAPLLLGDRTKVKEV